MFKTNHSSKTLPRCVVMICLAFTSFVNAKDIKFDLAFDEFVLKNTYPLITQIKKQSGLAFQSINYQISKSGCQSSILSSPKILNEKDPYSFYKKLSNSIDDCSQTKSTSSQKVELPKLLEDKEPYLVIAGESLNSPMSYFGHSLLLFLNKKDFYFSPVVSVLAPLDEQNILSQTVKGGFSTIKAEVTVTPLHQIISFYNNQESRSLKFIKLSNSHFNTDKLIRYFDNELPNNLSYNFFANNCSTYLYQALQYACSCFDESKTIISPSYVAKKVQQLGTPDAFNLPSLFTRFNLAYSNLTDSEKDAVKSLILNGDNHSNYNFKKVGNTAALASQLSFETYHEPYSSYTELMKNYGKDTFLLNKLPDVEQYKGQQLDKLNLSSLKLSLHEKQQKMRISAIDYNDFEQRNNKFLSSQMSALVFDISHREETSRVDAFTLIDITTIKPIDFVSKKSSWRFKLGSERNQEDKLKTLLSFGVGSSLSVNNTKLYVIPSVDMTSSTKLKLYSGLQFKSSLISVNYKNNGFEHHELNFYRRNNTAFGYEYKIEKRYKEEVDHSISINYYF